MASKSLNQFFLILCVMICYSPEFQGTDTQVPASEFHEIMFVKKASLWSWRTTHIPLSSFTQWALDKLTFSSFTDFALLIWVFDLLSAALCFCSLPFFLDKVQYYETVWMMNRGKIKRQRIALILQTWASLSSPNKGLKRYFQLFTQCLLPWRCSRCLTSRETNSSLSLISNSCTDSK